MALVKLGSVAKECRQNWSGDTHNVPVVGLEHLTPGDVTLSKWEDGSDNTFTKKFEKGQVLLGRRRVYLKKAVIAPFDGICSGDITVIEALPDKILPELLPFVIQNDRFFDYAEQGSAGSLSPRVKWEHLKDYEFELPVLSDQKRLSDELWAAYRLKQSYQALIDATDELVKSRFIEQFGERRDKRIGDVCEVHGGSTPDRKNPAFWEGGNIPWFTIEDIYSQGEFIYTTSQHVTDLGAKKLYMYPVDTVLVCCTASVGECALTKEIMSSNQQFNGLIIRDKKEMLPEFLLYVSKTLKPELLQLSGKTTIHFVSRSSLEDIKIPVPSIEEQRLFVSINRQADKSKFELKQAIEKIDKVMRALLQ